MTRYKVRVRIYDDVELTVDAPEAAIEQDVIDRAVRELLEKRPGTTWLVDEERVRARRV